MTISSDIVSGVARAAEPSGIKAARTEPARRPGSIPTTAPEAFSLAEAANARSTAAGIEKTAAPATFKRFEAMVLQTFIQNMLPKEGSAVYGKGMAGDMWKSLLSEKIADVMAERGGIGISDRVLGDHYAGGKTLSVVAASGQAGKSDAGGQAALPATIIQDMQRQLARSLAQDQASTVSQPEI